MKAADSLINMDKTFAVTQVKDSFKAFCCVQKILKKATFNKISKN